MINLRDFEKKIYIGILIDIFKFTLNNTNVNNDDIIFSEFKLLHIILSNNTISAEKESHIFQNQNITKLILDSKNITDLMKIEILKIIVNFYSRKEKNEILIHIKRIEKQIKKDAWAPYIKTKYDKKTFARANINQNMLLMSFVVEYINYQTFYHFNYIKEKLKNEILSLPNMINLTDIKTYLTKYPEKILNYAIQELMREGKLSISDEIVMH